MPCAGVVLTGGASRRMGRDKATVALQPAGPTLAQRTGAILAACTAPAVELGPGASGLPARGDAGGGPLRTLAAADRLWHELPDNGQVVVLATDMPRLTSRLVHWLADHPAAGAVIPVDGGRRQLLCARYPVLALRSAGPAVAAGETSLARWSAGLDVHEAAPDEWGVAAGGDSRALRDADTPAALNALCSPSFPPVAQ